MHPTFIGLYHDLIVHLKAETSVRVGWPLVLCVQVLELSVDGDHSSFGHIGCCALYDGVDGLTLSGRSLALIVTVKVGKRTDALVRRPSHTLQGRGSQPSEKRE
jgi:hypothetical protein